MPQQTIEKWNYIELSFHGIPDGNPFTERTIRATFTCPREEVTVDGFYDGEGIYRVRFMPSFEGEYTYRVEGTFAGTEYENMIVTTTPQAAPSTETESAIVGTTTPQAAPSAETCSAGVSVSTPQIVPSTESCPTDTTSETNNEECSPLTGTFRVTPPTGNNHGPVHVASTYHFAYADGEPYYPLGTTCYVWELQSDELIEQTLATLKDSAFNKIRFCIFPKHYDYNLHEPRSYPYEGTPMDSSVLTKENFGQYTFRTEGNHFDYSRFNPKHFQHIETCIRKLQELGIEADLIVMHPYDRWGFATMTPEENELYWKYVIARFAAYRNVWWSLANEYDLFPTKTTRDWERYGQIICEKDPYRHLTSIHNCMPFYDHRRPWITHCSIQRQDLYKSSELVNEWRATYRKPVVLDEIAYEGNIQHGWGNITGEEMLRRFWEAACRGGYPGHGETYLNPPAEPTSHPHDILWWSHGGTLHGESHERFHLLAQILRETPGPGLAPYERCSWDEVCAVPENEFPYPVKSYYLYYYSFMRPSFRDYYFDDTTDYEVRVIDTWNMTIENRGIHRGHFRIQLPGRQYIAVQIRRI